MITQLLHLSTEKVQQVVDDILTVEKHISGIEILALPDSFMMYEQILENSYLNSFTIDDFQNEVPFVRCLPSFPFCKMIIGLELLFQINWKNYFQSAFSQVNISINSSSQIVRIISILCITLTVLQFKHIYS